MKRILPTLWYEYEACLPQFQFQMNFTTKLISSYPWTFEYFKKKESQPKSELSMRLKTNATCFQPYCRDLLRQSLKYKMHS